MPNANHKPKGRFFRSVGLYLTDIAIEIATNGAIFGAKWRKGIGQIGSIGLIGRQLIDSLTR